MSDSPTTRTIARPTARGIARRWHVALEPQAALAAIAGSPDVTPQSAEVLLGSPPVGEDDRVFVADSREGGIVLWRRPVRGWSGRFTGLLEPVPHPEMLHVTASAATDGTHVVARWRRHPSTKAALIFNGVGPLLAVAICVALLGGQTLWMLPFLVVTLLIPFHRLLTANRARASLLAVAHRPLAAAELGPVDATESAFRRREIAQVRAPVPDKQAHD